MVLLKSKTISTNKSADYIFDYLSELSNFERLMPDNVRSFQIENDCAILDIQGIGKLELAVTEAVSPKKDKIDCCLSKILNFFLHIWDLRMQEIAFASRTEGACAIILWNFEEIRNDFSQLSQKSRAELYIGPNWLAVKKNWN